MKPSTAALLRVSLDSQTTDPQRLAIEGWAATKGFAVAAWYEEPGISGASKFRPVRDAMLEACRKGKHDTIVVAALDRIGRNASELVAILAELSALKVRLFSIREDLDFSGSLGQLIGSVLAFIAQIERESIVARTKAGIAAAKAKGVHCGPPPLIIPDSVLEEARRRFPTETLAEIAPTLDGCWKRVTENGVRTERPWKPSASTLARRLGVGK